MKKIYILSLKLLICIASTIQAQNANLIMDGSVRLVANGSPYIVMSNADWIDNSTGTGGFTPASSQVKFDGSSAASISGTATNPTTFYDLNFNKNANLNIEKDININNQLAMNGTNANFLIDNNKVVTLSSSATVVGESNSDRITTSNQDNNAQIRIVNLDINALGTYNPGNLGLELNFISGNTPGITTVTRYLGRPAGFITGNRGAYRSFRVQPTVNTGLNYDVTFNYFDNEIPVNFDENELKIYKAPSTATIVFSNTSSNIWTVQPASTVNTASNFVSLNGQNSFSFFTISDDQNEPLPVSLISFTAECKNGDVLIQWTTATEVNSEYFNVEYSYDGANWIYLNRVQAAGFSNQILKYSYIHKEPLGNVYFRLVQVDFNGKTQIYGPLKNTCDLKAGDWLSSMTLYPNPAKDITNLSIILNKDMPNAMIQMFDMTGRAILSQRMDLIEGDNNLVFDVSSYLPGVYNIRVSDSSTLLPIKRLVINR